MKQKHLIYILTGVVALWIIFPVLAILFFGKPDSSDTFGDTYGIVNALFSSLAFALLIYTAWMQKEELSLQREELKLTREEIAKSAVAQVKLVELTTEQLMVQKTIRRTNIRPRLYGPPDVKAKMGSDGVYYILQLMNLDNLVRIDKVEVVGEKDNKIHVLVKRQADVTYVLPKSMVQFEVYHEDCEEFLMSKLNFAFHLIDIDSNVYVQVLTWVMGEPFLLDPVFREVTQLEDQP